MNTHLLTSKIGVGVSFRKYLSYIFEITIIFKLPGIIICIPFLIDTSLS